ncbi:Imm1 family immunity protein [Actinocorallia herbida]|uniref:Imm1 family immunity protein n=1 Tax=Actinocorallia herbida TaxID=58109 RepID=UPI001476E342|nr:Imm1 family immunity protein [Actinocorallia herbida]
MNLHVEMDRSRYFSVSWERAEKLIGEVMGDLPDLRPPGSPEPGNEQVPPEVLEAFAKLPELNRPYGGTVASFVFDAPDRDLYQWSYDSCLMVAFNAMTGYGAFLWVARAESGLHIDPGEPEHVWWLSDGSCPPSTDPHVRNPLQTPPYHDPRCALPAPQVRAVLEEFCRTGSGHRPTSIEWTPGDGYGQRLDGPRLLPAPAQEGIDHLVISDDPWS